MTNASLSIGNLPGTYDIAHYRRDTFIRSLTLCQDDAAETPLDLTGSTFAMQVRKARSGDVVVSVSTATGEITLVPLLGQVRIQFTDPQNAALPEGCPMVWDLQMTTAANIVKTVLRGKFDVENDVTT